MAVREAKPWTIMSSYNKINGVYAQGNYDLLTKVLRDDWGFNGIVMTDWIGKRADLPVAEEVHAGNDLFMPGYPAQAEDIAKAVKEGKLDIKDVDRNVRRMLEYIVKTPRFRKYAFSNKPDLKAHAQVTRQTSTEGMVLLKNGDINGKAVLPMEGIKRVALFGVNSYDFMSGGLGSGCVNVPYVVDMVDGLKNAGVSTTPQLTDIYTKYVAYAKSKLKADKNPWMWFLDQGQPKLDEIDITQRCVEHEAPEADAAIITTPWDELDGKAILSAIEKVSLADELLEKMRAEHEADEHEHHHHHHDGEKCDNPNCSCHHHHDDDDHDEHEHHHDHEEHEHHHDHDHDHHHHDHDEDECDDPNCSCHHHHHHADEVFISWGKETPKVYAQTDIDRILTALDSGEYGAILRAKGIVNGADGAWIEFDYVPEEHEIRAGLPDYTGRLCVIGSNLKEDKLAELFGL